MKLFSRLACAFVLLATTPGLFAATTPPAAQLPAPPPAASPGPPGSNLKFDDYINDLAGALKLSDEEKTTITGFYQADGAQLESILNNDSLSPLDQDRQVSAIRAARNAKIEALLGSDDRMAAFLKVEATYRVALIELAADGGLVPSSAPAPTQAPVSAKTPPE